MEMLINNLFFFALGIVLGLPFWFALSILLTRPDKNNKLPSKDDWKNFT